MRYREFLLEYNRDVTKRQFGEKIVDKLQHSPDKDLFYAYYKSLGEKEYPIDKIIDTIATNILSSLMIYLSPAISRPIDPRTLAIVAARSEAAIT